MAKPQPTAAIAVNPAPEITAGVSRYEHWANALVIQTPADYERAINALKDIKTIRAKIAESFADSKQKADEAWKSIVAHEKSFTDRCDNAERTAKGVLVSYQRAEEAKAEEKRRHEQAIEDERVRKENERLAKEAAKAEKKGQVEKAQELRETAETNVATVIAPQSNVPEIKGASTRKTWKAEVVDLEFFLRSACAAGRTDLLLPNLKTIDAYAKGMRERASMQGIRFYEESSLAIGGR